MINSPCCITSWSFKCASKDDLVKETIVSIAVKDREPGNPHSEVGDSVVDRLLLRYLSPRMSRIRCNEAILAHLIAGNSLPKSFDEPRHLFRIPRFVHEPGHRGFFKQFQRLLLNLF